MKDNTSTVAELLLKELYRLGVEFVFLVPGAQIIPLVNTLFEKHESNIPQPIIANHELSAGFMAIGYAQASGKIGTAFSIGGPGAAYMIGASVSAKADDIPVLFVTGNIPPKNFGKGEFQDASPQGTNDSAIFHEAIGNSIICNKPEDIEYVFTKLHSSFHTSKPFHVQIPINVQKAHYPLDFKPDLNNRKRLNISVNGLLEKSVLLLGQKVLDSIDKSILKNFVKRNIIPIVTDMKTRGILDETSQESLGYIGFNSDIRALEVFNPLSPLVADNIISIGIRKELVNQYIDNTKIKVNTIDPQLVNNFLKKAKTNEIIKDIRKKWLNELNEISSRKLETIKYKDKISFSELFETINMVANENVIYCLDSGQIRRAGSVFITCRTPRTLIQSETLAPMGSGICASIGIQLANPKKRVISLFGDGSMRMHGMELSTAVRYKLPIIFILCDNQSYATVKVLKEAKILPKTNWSAYAQLIGIKSFFADNQIDFSNALKECFISNEPILIWTSVPVSLENEFKVTHKLEYKSWLSEI
jgi:acetolactate synthase I/II/III large subunit